jgi:hypothetical protein
MRERRHTVSSVRLSSAEDRKHGLTFAAKARAVALRGVQLPSHADGVNSENYGPQPAETPFLYCVPYGT